MVMLAGDVEENPVLHEGEYAIDEALVAGLVSGQIPQWSDLPLVRINSSGTCNAIYRLGDDMAVRLPLLSDFSSAIERENLWLQRFAPLLPLSIPGPLATGNPTDSYPSVWSVLRWIDGETATLENLVDPVDAAIRLGEFVLALRNIGTVGGPTGNYKGLPLGTRDAQTRETIKLVNNEFDSRELTRAWEAALAVAPWSGEPMWFHSDLHSGNLLATNGRLSAVIDFGGASVGDPSCDLIAGWWLFDTESRGSFRETVQADDDSWNRGRGWALSVALIALPYYVDTNPEFAEMARRAIRQVLDDQQADTPYS